MLRSLSGLCVLLAGLHCFSAAQAQDADRELARTNFQNGVERFEAGDYDAALESFQTAYRLSPHYSVRANMANCYERLARPIEALFNYERFLSEAGDGASEARVEEVQAAIARLQATIGQLVLNVSPEGTQITIDGDEQHTAPVGSPIPVTAGVHTVEFSREGYLSTTRQVVIEGGGMSSIRVSLRREVAEQPTPVTPVEAVEAGADTEEVTEPEETSTDEATDEFDEEPVEDDDEAENPHAEEEEEEEEDTGPGFFASLETPTLIAGGAAIALTAIGVATGVAALGADSDFEDAVVRSNDESLTEDERAAARDEGLDAESRANTLALVTDLMFAGAIVGAGVAVYFEFFRDGESDGSEQTEIEASPILTPDTAGVVISGRF